MQDMERSDYGRGRLRRYERCILTAIMLASGLVSMAIGGGLVWLVIWVVTK
jgi:hypothetical protein